MKRPAMLMKSVLVETLLLTFGLCSAVQAVTVNIVSDTNWTVSKTDGTYVGKAQNVCLGATVPSNCPAGAAIYGYPLVGWAANLTSIPGAKWIWAPGITGSTTSAANAEFTFQREFYLCGAPQGGTISIASDDRAEVFLNGATTPILTSTSHSTLSTVAIPAASLAQGLNIIQVKAKNDLNPPDCPSGRYQCNPAAVVVGATFQDALPALPTCTDQGQTYTVGQFEPVPCPAGQVGSAARPCICIGSNGVWGPVFSSCVATCAGANGMIFSVGDTETLPCPPGLTGSASHTCQANGTWGATSTVGCVPPPTTCTGSSGALFAVGMSEALPCPPGQVGSPPLSHTCLANGTWGPTSGICVLPLVTAGGICGASDKGLTGTCPAGTTCKPRKLPKTPTPWWCVFFELSPVKPNECRRSENLQTTDWFCDP